MRGSWSYDGRLDEKPGLERRGLEREREWRGDTPVRGPRKSLEEKDQTEAFEGLRETLADLRCSDRDRLSD